MSEWLRITIAVKPQTLLSVKRIKERQGLTYDELLTEYLRLRSMYERQRQKEVLKMRTYTALAFFTAGLAYGFMFLAKLI
ncbi:MAG: hypothetical protein ACP5LI_05915 [Hydrogenobaculum sp.]